MQQIPWFERTFDFSYEQNIFPAVLERLADTPIRLEAKVQGLAPVVLDAKPDGKWSIKEHIGHLIDLEPIWQGRLEDILTGQAYLRTADLDNRQTDRAQHNHSDLTDLLDRFRAVRQKTLQLLAPLDDTAIYRTALHPRLHQPMRTMDLFLFVAEHDDHHLARISAILRA
ncbi:MAG: DinB family protein [Lewinella sp.]|nr:DinB family protein [Lewinella sp.]